jgi:hypothetical protein
MPDGLTVEQRGRRVWAVVDGQRCRVVPVVVETDDGPAIAWQLWGPAAVRLAWRVAARRRDLRVPGDRVDLGPAGDAALAAWGGDLAAVAADQARREANRLPPLPRPSRAHPRWPSGHWVRLSRPDADWQVTWPGLLHNRPITWTGQVSHHGHRLTVRYATAGAGVWTLRIAASGLRWILPDGTPGRTLTAAEGLALAAVWRRAAWWGGSRAWVRWSRHLAALALTRPVWEQDWCRHAPGAYHAVGPRTGWQVHLQETPWAAPPDQVTCQAEANGRGPGDVWVWETGGLAAMLACYASGDVWVTGQAQILWISTETRDVWATIQPVRGPRA